MQFALTDEQRMIAETAQAFFVEEAGSKRTRAAMAEDGMDYALWSAFCNELGLAGAHLPEECGGVGLGMVEFACIAEAAGSCIAALPILGLAMAGSAIAAGGSDAQKAEWLPQIASGEIIAAFAEGSGFMCENNKLSGIARFVPHGALVDIIVIGQGADSFVVMADDPGVSRETFTTLDQTRPLAHLSFSDVRFERLFDGQRANTAATASGLLCLAAEAVGGAQSAIDLTVSYAQERMQFGRPIGSFQAYKHRLADRVVDLEQARSAMYWAACAVDEISDEAPLALAAAKSFCGDTFFQCAADMIQLHGGIGFTWEHDAHLYFKRARSIQTLLGSNDEHRERIASIVLRQTA